MNVRALLLPMRMMAMLGDEYPVGNFYKPKIDVYSQLFRVALFSSCAYQAEIRGRILTARVAVHTTQRQISPSIILPTTNAVTGATSRQNSAGLNSCITQSCITQGNSVLAAKLQETNLFANLAKM